MQRTCYVEMGWSGQPGFVPTRASHRPSRPSTSSLQASACRLSIIVNLFYERYMKRARAKIKRAEKVFHFRILFLAMLCPLKSVVPRAFSFIFHSCLLVSLVLCFYCSLVCLAFYRYSFHSLRFNPTIRPPAPSLPIPCPPLPPPLPIGAHTNTHSSQVFGATAWVHCTIKFNGCKQHKRRG